MTIDGTLCPFDEIYLHPTKTKDPKYFSFKHQRAGLLYEVALSIYEDRCVWINGPTPGVETNDKGIFNRALRHLIPSGKKGLTDSGYICKYDTHILTWKRVGDTPEVRLFKRRALARQEVFNSRMKRFECLSTVFRHSEDGHKSAFFAIAVMCQYQMELGSPLFKAGV